VLPSPRVLQQLRRATKRAPPAPTVAAVEGARPAAAAEGAHQPVTYDVEIDGVDLSNDEALGALARCVGSLSCELRALTLAHGALGTPHLRTLMRAMPPSAPLVTLDLTAQQLSTAALDILLDAAARGACPSLVSLTLDANPLGDALPLDTSREDTATWLSQLPRGRGGWQLHQLRLAATLLGPLGLAALARALARAPALERLDVSRNEMTLGGSGGGGDGAHGGVHGGAAFGDSGVRPVSAPMRRLASAWVESGKEEGGLVTDW
jgi:hypothetical protein